MQTNGAEGSHGAAGVGGLYPHADSSSRVPYELHPFCEGLIDDPSEETAAMWEGRETLPCPSLHLHYWPIALTWALGRAALLSMGL